MPDFAPPCRVNLPFGPSILMAVEDHGAGNQFVRVRVWPGHAVTELFPSSLFGSLAVVAALDQAWVASGVLSLLSYFLMMHALRDCGSAFATVLHTLQQSEAVRDGQKEIQ